jgi:hypothetical protein
MPSLKDFTEAMNASWPVALAIMLGATAVLLSHHYEVAYVQALPGWMLSIAFLIALFSGAIIVVAIIRGLLDLFKMPFRRRRAKKWKERHVHQIGNLPQSEMHVLIWAAVNNTQVFLAPMNHERLEPLIAKSYIQMLAGRHSIIDWPYKVPDHIWDTLTADQSKLPPPDRVSSPFSRW